MTTTTSYKSILLHVTEVIVAIMTLPTITLLIPALKKSTKHDDDNGVSVIRPVVIQVRCLLN